MKFKLVLASLLLLMVMPEIGLSQGSRGDDDIPVVTVRKKYFLKGKRLEGNISAGVISNDSFVDTYSFSASLGYHFNEFWFVEVPFGIFVNSDSSDTTNLESNFGITIDSDDLNYFAEAHVGWTPIYGKLNFIGKKIVYFDTSIYVGGGITDADLSGASPHAVVGLAPRFVLTKWLALRLEVKDTIIFRGSTGVNSSIRNVVGFHAGLSFFFPKR